LQEDSPIAPPNMIALNAVNIFSLAFTF
jgi:hypothetical protein